MNENQIDEQSLQQLKEMFEQLKKETGFEPDENYKDVLENISDEEWEEMENDLYEQMNKKTLKVKKLVPDAVIPKYNYPTDSGFDIHSTIDIEIPPFGRYLIPTGLSFQFEIGNEIQIRTKSGLAINQGLMVLNSPGTVDQGYSGEIKVPVFNANPHPIQITKGMKVAQGVLCPVFNGKKVEVVETEDFDETDRGNNGVGSTGI